MDSVDITTIVKIINRPSSSVRKQCADNKHQERLAQYENGELTEKPAHKKRRKRGFQNPKPTVFSVDDKGIGGTLLNSWISSRTDMIIEEGWAHLHEFPKDLYFFINSPNSAVAEIAKVVQAGRANGYGGVECRPLLCVFLYSM